MRFLGAGSWGSVLVVQCSGMVVLCSRVSSTHIWILFSCLGCLLFTIYLDLDLYLYVYAYSPHCVEISSIDFFFSLLFFVLFISPSTP